MTSSLFLSYSRREAPFVDALAGKLEDNGYQVWLDYKSLVPGKPWADQIDNGIVEADTFLFVVSKQALASEYVELEWKRAIELHKRIVLVLFETTKLPPELAHYAWVDFRAAFENSVIKLTNLLKNPTKPEQLAPQTGFNSPPVVWASFAASLAIAILALPTFWTLYIPYHLVPLPYRILRRNFNFFHVQSALVMLPFALFISAMILSPGISDPNLPDDDPILGRWVCTFGLSILFLFILIPLIRSKGMQRWGKPVASRPKFSNVQIPNIENPQPTTFSLDSAPEDSKYAAEIKTTLEKYGHSYDSGGKNAEAAFVLVSVYNNSTSLNPEERAVYPIIIQAIDDIDDKLQMIQWIDFRNGLKNLDALAQLLPEPARLLKALGIVPAGEQTVLPRIILALVNFLTILAIFSAGSYAVFLYQFSADLVSSYWAGALFCLILPLVLFFGIIFFTTRSLTNRTGKFASPYLLVLAIVLIGLFTFVQSGASMAIAGTIDPTGTSGLTAFIGPLAYLIGLVMIIPLALYYWKELQRWFPAKVNPNKAAVE